MKKNSSILSKSILSIAIAGALSSVSFTNLIAEELDVIRVESTTIDDRFENKRNEASNIAVISGEKIDAAHTKNVQEMLQGIPGITTELQSGDSLKIHIRGIENQVYMGEKPGVAVVIDGVPVFERTGRVNLDMDNIESIKVIKGGASYLFGDDALSGAIIITTKRGAKHQGYTTGVEVGSFNYQKGLVRAGFASENANGHVQVSRRETDSYYDDAASRADYLNGKLQYYIDDSSDLTFGLERADRFKNSHGSVKGVTAAENDPRSTDINSYNDYTNHYEVDLAKYFLTYSKDYSENDNLMVNLYSFGDDTKFHSKPDRTDPTIYTYDNDYKQVQNGLKAEYRSSGKGLAWMAAVDLRENQYKNNVIYKIDYDPFGPAPVIPAGTPYSDDTTDESVQALYGEMKFQVSDPLVLTVNGRLDHIAYDYTSNLSALNLDKSFDVNSWRFGGNYALASNRDLYANISTGFRAPSVTQLFSGDISPTGSTDSNPNLKPEHAINKEIGFRTKIELFGASTDVDIAIFQIDRDDYIMKTSGQYGDYDGGANDMYDNIGGVQNRGLELAMKSVVSSKLSWLVAYTYLDARFTQYDNFNLGLGNPYGTTVASCGAMVDPTTENCVEHYDNTGNVVPRTSNHTVNLAVTYKPASNWTVTGEINSKSDYYADEINRIKMKGFSTFNLLANYDRKIGKNTWSFFARIDNVLDSRHYNTVRGTGDAKTVDSDADGIYDTYDGVYDAEDLSIVVNPGRSYTAGLSVTF
ncbi:MAG: TonB-dependent receptor [Gammaproteobacteria bacterium]|nr:TonB-dependent receptor [Gammaproteobacteria bacterium]